MTIQDVMQFVGYCLAAWGLGYSGGLLEQWFRKLFDVL